ncbi:MAG: ATP-binding protein [Solirubrobacterales bacterium]
MRRDPVSLAAGIACLLVGAMFGLDQLGTVSLGPGVVLATICAAAGLVTVFSRRGVGVALLAIAVLPLLSEAGLPLSDAIVWPLVLVGVGLALLWDFSQASAEPRPAVPASPAQGAGDRTARVSRRPGIALTAVYRGGFGIALVLGAGLLFLSANDALGAARDATFTAVVTIVAFGLILAPFIWRLGRNLAAERAERIRSQERAEVAAHLHDSVLQTLTLMQKRADDPREVAALARRQERELRDWLAGGSAGDAEARFAAALRAAAEGVEDDQRVKIDVVAVGDCELDEPATALVAAAREALINAAKFAPEGTISVYAEVTPERIEAFVRDRGPGFDPAAVPPDRRGLSESIVGRMRRNGGDATIDSVPGAGTEIALSLDREGARS